MTDPVPLASAVVEAMSRGDTGELHRLVPERFWGWLDHYLRSDDGWPTVDVLAGTPRRVTGARTVGADTARLTLRGPRGEAFVTARFDENDRLKGFTVEPEEYDGIANIVVTCPDDRTAELRAFYTALVGHDPRRRPRLRFDEGDAYVAPRWPDSHHPQQMHLDIHVRDPDRARRAVEERGATLLADAGSHRTYADPIGHPFCLYSADRDGLWRVVVDCPDAAVLEAFYAGLLGPAPVPPLAFQEVSPYVAPRWPDPAFPAQMHLDVAVDDRAALAERIARAGATRLPSQGGSCPVYADPAGHPFCLCLHGE